MHVGSLVTLVAGVHYMYMREFWVQVHTSPIVYRYVDWSITVPLQMIEFNLILKAAKDVKDDFMHMREYWVQIHKSPVVYCYID